MENNTCRQLHTKTNAFSVNMIRNKKPPPNLRTKILLAPKAFHITFPDYNPIPSGTYLYFEFHPSQAAKSL